MKRKKNQSRYKKLIEISVTPEGNFETKFWIPVGKVDSIMIGVALASATRVVAESFRQEMGLNKFHNEQIEAQIAKFYNDDLKMGSLGEDETTKPA